MEGTFPEFENENALRSYPFAAGCTGYGESGVPMDLFVDAALYPVNSSGRLYLSSVSESGVFTVSDASGPVMSGTASGSAVELYDMSGLSRRSGTLAASSSGALSEFAGRGVAREFSPDQTAFASSCVMPVTIDGVTSMSVGDTGMVSGSVSFANGPDDPVRVSSGTAPDGRSTLRFDVLPRPGASDVASIRRIICVVDGQTPFRIEKLSYNTVMLSLEGIDKEDVCAYARRGEGMEIADTCICGGEGTDPCPKELPDRKDIPETYQVAEVFIPPDPDGSGGGVPDGADNAFYLVVPNVLGYANPLSLTLEEGVVSPRISEPEVEISGQTADLAEGETVDSLTSNAVVLQVPGLSGGET